MGDNTMYLSIQDFKAFRRQGFTPHEACEHACAVNNVTQEQFMEWWPEAIPPIEYKPLTLVKGANYDAPDLG